MRLSTSCEMKYLDLMPINDQSLTVFSNDNYRMIMHTDEQYGIEISVIKE